jgi:hypothetical protein
LDGINLPFAIFNPKYELEKRRECANIVLSYYPVLHRMYYFHIKWIAEMGFSEPYSHLTELDDVAKGKISRQGQAAISSLDLFLPSSGAKIWFA